MMFSLATFLVHTLSLSTPCALGTLVLRMFLEHNKNSSFSGSLHLLYNMEIHGAHSCISFKSCSMNLQAFSDHPV